MPCRWATRQSQRRARMPPQASRRLVEFRRALPKCDRKRTPVAAAPGPGNACVHWGAVRTRRERRVRAVLAPWRFRFLRVSPRGDQRVRGRVGDARPHQIAGPSINTSRPFSPRSARAAAGGAAEIRRAGTPRLPRLRRRGRRLRPLSPRRLCARDPGCLLVYGPRLLSILDCRPVRGHTRRAEPAPPDLRNRPAARQRRWPATKRLRSGAFDAKTGDHRRQWLRTE